MSVGCCGHMPALSGYAADHEPPSPGTLILRGEFRRAFWEIGRGIVGTIFGTLFFVAWFVAVLC
jgi:hypothetical protein